ncbi:EcsC family protein [Bacteroides acidifaciens]|uniref:EcsC family protein n=1 Tax=Bacteroides acidifaciens TaxID=85831 RepID=UPI00158EAD1E|nr:EcsC family protein [Bacteroides acidifaciens]MDE6822352.1 EcsC family protein [Bacteroides acidifaciens]
MNTYEESQIKDIKIWKATEPSVVSKAVGYMTKPIVLVANRIIPQKAIQGALTASNTLAKLITDEQDIIRNAKVNSIIELKTKDLQLSDKLADEVHNWALAGLGLEGGVTGFFGLPGMFVDIPMVVTIALRTIHKIGICYGYKALTLEDTQFVYSIMSVAGSNSMQEKNMALVTLKQLNVILVKQSWKKMAEKATVNKYCSEAILITIKSLAKQLGINITKRKAIQAIPLIGAGVGATMNIAFINDICLAARRSFQERWLIDNGKVQSI